MAYNSKYTGQEVENLLDQIAKGNAGDGDITTESDPIFSASPAASITEEKKTEWDNKVDKVSGKQLSTEDFTSALKSKLEGLNNYDDTELSNALSTLRGDFDKLVSGDTTTAIKTFNEVIAFLDGIQDTQDLSSIIASIEQQVAGKMDKVTLATVATSGDYNDLSNKPTIPTKLSDLRNGNILTCEFMGEVGDIIWSDDDQDRIDYIANWMEELSLGKVCVLDFDEYEDTYAMVHAINYRTDTTYGIGKVYFSYVFEGYLYDVEYESVSLPVTLTIVSKTKIGGEGGSNTDGGAEPMVCAYRIASYTANHIELENYTYNGQTMDYREGAIISILNPNSADVVFEGGTLTLDGNEYEANAFTLKSGATALFSLGPDPGVLLPVSSVGGATTTNNKLPLEDTTITLEGNVLSGNVYVIPNTISSLSVDIIEPTDGVLVKDYIIHFFTGASVSSFSFPDELLWANGNAPTIEESTAYELSVVATSMGGGYVYKGVLTVFK